MNKPSGCYLIGALLLSLSSYAAEPKPTQSAQPSMMDQAGPWTRKIANERAVKKEIEAFLKEEEALSQVPDLEKSASRNAYPVFMASDDSKGRVEANSYTRDQFIQMMKPMYETMPKDMKTTSKPSIFLLSDAMALVVNDYQSLTGGKRYDGRYGALVIKQDGRWMWKGMFEAGWGGMEEPGTGGTGTPSEPAPKRP